MIVGDTLSNIVKYEEDKDFETRMLELEFQLVGIDESNFERDKEVISDIYKSAYEKKLRPPSLREIELEVLDFNYDICFQISKIEFEINYREESIKTLAKSFGIPCGQLCERVDIDEYQMHQVATMSTQMINDYSWRYSNAIRDCIRDSLNDLDVIYEDDDFGNPIFGDPLFDIETHVVFVNNAQQVMFKELYAEEYSYGRRTFDGVYEDITNFTVERRSERIKNPSRLLGE